MKNLLRPVTITLTLGVALFFIAGCQPTERLPNFDQAPPHVQLMLPLPSQTPEAPETYGKPEPVIKTAPKTTKPKVQFKLSAQEQGMLTLVNREREAHNLKPLRIDPRLVELARLKSQDIIDFDYWDHTSPTYGTPFEMLKAAGLYYPPTGENLAKAGCYKIAHHALMDSDGHRANLLHSSFTHIGIGIVDNGSQGLVITQLFYTAK